MQPAVRAARSAKAGHFALMRQSWRAAGAPMCSATYATPNCPRSGGKKTLTLRQAAEAPVPPGSPSRCCLARPRHEQHGLSASQLSGIAGRQRAQQSEAASVCWGIP